MRGFKPDVAQQMQAQNFADGGMVQGIKRLLRMDPERNARLAEYRAREAQEKQAAAQAAKPVAAPPAAKALNQYAAGNGLKERMKEIDGYANGGPVRGPGNGTSDDVPDQVPEGTYIMPTDSTQAIGEQQLGAMGAKNIPVNLSNGEYKLPPEQVHAVGVQALDQMKDATHTPAPPNPAKGMRPELFFDDGGVATEEELRSKQQAVQGAPGVVRNGNAYSDAPAAPAQRPAVPEAPAQAKPNFFPGNSPDAGANIYAGAGPANGFGSSGQLATGAERVIGAQPPQVSQQAARPAPQERPMQSAVAPQPAAQPPAATALDAMALHQQRLDAANARQAQRQMPNNAPNPADGARLSQNYQAAQQKAVGLQPSYFTQEGPGAAGARAAAEAEASSALQAMYQRPGNSASNPVSATAQPTSAASPAAGSAPPVQPGQVQAKGVSALASGQAQDVAQEAEQPQAQQVMPGVYRSGNSYSDSPTGFSTGSTGRPNAQNMAAADALAGRSQQESMGRVQAQMQKEQYDREVMQARSINAASAQAAAANISGKKGYFRQKLDQEQQSAGMQDATARRGQDAAAAAEARRSATDDRRIAMDGRRITADEGRYALDAKAKGFDIRQAERMEKLQSDYLEAQDDPKKAESIAQKMRVLSGKGAEMQNRFTAVSGGQEWDQQAGSMRNVPGRVLNNQTGQWVQDGPAPAQAPIGQNPRALAIKNDTKMTNEQKRAALAQLGY